MNRTQTSAGRSASRGSVAEEMSGGLGATKVRSANKKDILQKVMKKLISKTTGERIASGSRNSKVSG